MKNEGFTLIELIVVMAIIAVLVLLAAPRFLGYTKDANVTAMIQDTKVLSDAVEMYHVDTGDWPVNSSAPPVSLGVGGLDEIYPLDIDKVSNSIKNIKGKYGDYGVVIAGEHKGEVFHLNGVADSRGNYSYGYAAKNKQMKVDLLKRSIFQEKQFVGHGSSLIKTNEHHKGYPVYKNRVTKDGLGNNFGIRLEQDTTIPFRVNGAMINVQFYYNVREYINLTGRPLHGYITFETVDGDLVRYIIPSSCYVDSFNKNTHNEWIYVDWKVEVNENIKQIDRFFFYTDYASIGSEIDFTMPTLTVIDN